MHQDDAAPVELALKAQVSRPTLEFDVRTDQRRAAAFLLRPSSAVLRRPTQLDAYVDTELDANFRGLIAWVRKIEAATVAAATAAGLAPKAASDGAAPPRLPEGVPVTASAAEAEAALREFSLAWRAGVKALGDNVQRYFPDSRTTGFSVLKRVMGGFVDVYDRATAILARAFPPNAPFLRELVVPTTTLYYEIKRASRAFE